MSNLSAPPTNKLVVFHEQKSLFPQQYRKTLEMEPDFPIAHVWLGRAYEQKEMYREAVDAYQKQVLRQQLTELEQLSRQRYVAPLDIASIYARLGEQKQALEWLERAYDERFSLLPWLKLDPRFDSLHGEPGFIALLRKIGLEK